MGAAFSRDLPGQSRLKTAPTIQKQQIQNIVSFSIRLADFQARGVARVKLHLFRQDLPTKLKADFQQKLSGFFWFRISILSIQPAGAKLFSEVWLILSEK